MIKIKIKIKKSWQPGNRRSLLDTDKEVYPQHFIFMEK